MVSLFSLLGPLFVGTFLDLGLLGVVITQVFSYYTRFKNDHIGLKIFILLLFIISICNAALNNVSLYQTLVIHFDDIASIGVSPLAITASPAFTSTIAFLVQLFFGWRVYILLSKLWLVTIIAFLSFVQWLGGIGTTVAIARVHEISHFRDFDSIALVWLVCQVTADAAIAISLVYYLVTGVTGLPPSETRFDKLLRLTVHTGVMAAVIAFTQLIVYVSAAPGIHLLFGISLPNMYIIAMLSSLNSRAGWKYSRNPTSNMPSTNHQASFHIRHPSDHSNMNDTSWMESNNIVLGTMEPTDEDNDMSTDMKDASEHSCSSEKLEVGLAT